MRSTMVGGFFYVDDLCLCSTDLGGNAAVEAVGADFAVAAGVSAPVPVYPPFSTPVNVAAAVVFALPLSLLQ